MDLNERFERNPDFVLHETGPTRILVPLRTPIPHDVLVFLINGPVALMIWELLDGTRSGHDLVERVLSEFAVERPTAEAELTRFLAQLLRLAAVRPASREGA